MDLGIILLLRTLIERNVLKLRSFVNIVIDIHFTVKQSKGGLTVKFLKEVVQTMKDTTWETASETRKDTTTVIMMSLFLIIFFAVIDAAVQGFVSFI